MPVDPVFITAIQTAGATIIGYVGLALVAGIGVGVVVFGALKAWNTFRRAAH